MRNQQIKQVKNAKTHFRMYKSGKQWIFMGLTIAAFGTATAMTQANVHADTNNNNDSQTTNVASNADHTSTTTSTNSSATTSASSNTNNSASQVTSNSSTTNDNSNPASSSDINSNTTSANSNTNSSNTNVDNQIVTPASDTDDDISYRDGDSTTINRSAMLSSMQSVMSSVAQSSAAISANSAFVASQGSQVSRLQMNGFPNANQSQAQAYLMSMGSAMADLISSGNQNQLIMSMANYFLQPATNSNGSMMLQNIVMATGNYMPADSLASLASANPSSYDDLIVNGIAKYMNQNGNQMAIMQTSGSYAQISYADSSYYQLPSMAQGLAFAIATSASAVSNYAAAMSSANLSSAINNYMTASYAASSALSITSYTTTTISGWYTNASLNAPDDSTFASYAGYFTNAQSMYDSLNNTYQSSYAVPLSSAYANVITALNTIGATLSANNTYILHSYGSVLASSAAVAFSSAYQTTSTENVLNQSYAKSYANALSNASNTVAEFKTLSQNLPKDDQSYIDTFTTLSNQAEQSYAALSASAQSFATWQRNTDSFNASYQSNLASLNAINNSMSDNSYVVTKAQLNNLIGLANQNATQIDQQLALYHTAGDQIDTQSSAITSASNAIASLQSSYQTSSIAASKTDSVAKSVADSVQASMSVAQSSALASQQAHDQSVANSIANSTADSIKASLNAVQNSALASQKATDQSLASSVADSIKASMATDRSKAIATQKSADQVALSQAVQSANQSVANSLSASNEKQQSLNSQVAQSIANSQANSLKASAQSAIASQHAYDQSVASQANSTAQSISDSIQNQLNSQLASLNQQHTSQATTNSNSSNSNATTPTSQSSVVLSSSSSKVATSIATSSSNQFGFTSVSSTNSTANSSATTSQSNSSSSQSSASRPKAKLIEIFDPNYYGLSVKAIYEDRNQYHQEISLKQLNQKIAKRLIGQFVQAKRTVYLHQHFDFNHDRRQFKVKKGQFFTIKDVVIKGGITRFKLSNGKYLTSNRHFVKVINRLR